MTTNKQEKKNVMNPILKYGFLQYFLDQLEQIINNICSSNAVALLPNANIKGKEEQPLICFKFYADRIIVEWQEGESPQTRRNLGREIIKAFKLSPTYIGIPKTGKNLLIEWRWLRGRKKFKKTSKETEQKLITNEGQDLKGLQETSQETDTTLITKEGQDLPDAWNELVERQPQRILKGLKHVWDSRGTKGLHDDSIKRMLQETDASQLCHTKPQQKCRLDETYLPFPYLKEICSQFMEKDEVFPFLKLEKVSDVAEINSWLVLHTELGVKMHNNIEFLLDILKWIKISNDKSGHIEDPSRILRLYSAINTKFFRAGCNWKLKELQVIKNIRNMIGVAPNIIFRLFFQREEYIFAFDPVEGGSYRASWLYPGDCSWQGPDEMMRKRLLEPICQSLIDKSQVPSISFLLTQILDIRPISWSDLMSELMLQREQHSHDFAVVSGFYKYLHHIGGLPVEPETLKRIFEDESLVLATKHSQPGWYKPSECLWSSTIEQPGKVALNEYHEELKGFFIESLGVQPLTIQMPLMQNPIFPVVNPNGTKAIELASFSIRIWKSDQNPGLHCKGSLGSRSLFLNGLASLLAISPIVLSDRGLSWARIDLGLHNQLNTGDAVTSRIKLMQSSGNVAGTFNSPRYQADELKLFSLLQNATIHVADNIFTSLCIIQDGKVIKAKGNVAEIHIDEDRSRLNVYIPDDIREQEYCFCDLLPRELAQWLMGDFVHIPHIGKLLSLMGVMEVDISIDRKVSNGVTGLEMTKNDAPYQNTEKSLSSEKISEKPHTCETNKTGNLPQSRYTGYYSNFQDDQPSSPIPNHSTKKITTKSPSSKDADLFRQHLEIEGFSLVENVENQWYKHILNRVVPLARLTNFPSRGDLNKSARRQLLP
ncbi:uncharacterized protein N7483_011407 [Penicillium malachiteum]|uniref:uncharacterized protein n=1 Tax=Penicillium malachiteum TaxID=1324776 RepID=UPI0025495D38|nr:uncharacterized protein N7483_011407 [Penicillium malachiteum]KAJ5714226.1 hypothetical protein N7483_011407 [Penicillium malachiteum]